MKSGRSATALERKGEELEERLLEFAARVGKVVDVLVGKSIVTAKSKQQASRS